MANTQKKGKTFVLKNDLLRARAIEAVAGTPADGGHYVYIGESGEVRRVIQNNLYWFWLTALESQTGHEKEWLHRRFARSFLPGIYMANPETPAQTAWVDSFAMIQELAKGLPVDEYNQTILRVRSLCSTTWASVQQFAEYLSKLERFAYSKGFNLPRRDDYDEAMMH